MFRHRGNARTFQHNFRLAAFLSFTAGMVNICGVLALGVLTTNVTGHFAYFAEDVFKQDNLYGIYFLIYIIAFLSGSFVSSLVTEYCITRNIKAPHNFSILFEILILMAVGSYGNAIISWGVDKRLFACFLLFAMGIQNSLVSKISDSAVRTTHLTGLFTDLGIELSQLFFYKERNQKKTLLHSIRLRMGIIAFFFAGCIIGGFLYLILHLKALNIAAIVLILALYYDNLRLKFYKIRRRM